MSGGHGAGHGTAGGDLWLADDQMPSCGPCLEGRHDACPDLIQSPRYGTHACGCRNPIHDEGDTQP